MPLIWTALIFWAGIFSASILDWPVWVWWLAPGCGFLVLGLKLLLVRKGNQRSSTVLPALFTAWLLTAFCQGAVRRDPAKERLHRYLLRCK